MRRSFTLVLLLTSLCATAATNADADDIKFKIRIQPRLDLGDHASADGSKYTTQQDLYIRRSRLEVVGRPTEDVLYILAVAKDRAGQRGATSGADLIYAFVDYRLTPSVEIRAGRVKLPFTRSGWLSSSRLLLIERSQTVGAAASALGSYITPHLALHGRLRQGTIGYSIALMDGLQPGDSDRLSRQTVSASDNPGSVARVEFSPDGWVEGRESEAHLGLGRHLTVAVNGALQNGIEFDTRTEDRRVLGGDLSFHQGGLSFQAEYLRVNRDDGAQFSPAGWYAQVGWYLSRLSLEPAARFERYAADLPGGSDVTRTYMAGLNWYRHGHDFKFMANIVHTRYQRGVRQVDGAASRTLLQLHNQVYF